MTRSELHVADSAHRDGIDCARCQCVISAPQGRFMAGAVVVMPDGHYTSARLATDAEKRVGIVCVDAVRPRAAEMGGPL